MQRVVEPTLPQIPAEHLQRIERAAQRVEQIAAEQLNANPSWVEQRLQQQALALGKYQYYVAAQQQQLEQQQAAIAVLEQQLEQAQRRGKRQAAPWYSPARQGVVCAVEAFLAVRRRKRGKLERRTKAYQVRTQARS